MSHTAFPGVEETLKSLITSIDSDVLRRRRLPACSQSACRSFGICCSLTVAVTSEEVTVLTALLKERADLFRRFGCAISGDAFDLDRTTGRRYIRKKTRSFRGLHAIVRSFQDDKSGDLRLFRSLLRVCVFSTNDGSCTLQKVSEAIGPHRWYYKPVNCWKYPLGIAEGRLTLTNPASTPHFPCSKGTGAPAAEALREELAYLGKITGRDILREVAAREI